MYRVLSKLYLKIAIKYISLRISVAWLAGYRTDPGSIPEPAKDPSCTVEHRLYDAEGTTEKRRI